MTLNSISHNKELIKGLYLIPTPIGNLGDITYRAVQILQRSEFILCEDTRISGKLLNKFGIKSKLISNHKFNEKKNLSKIIDYLKNGKIISIISDAGTPGISDPGAILVRECVKENINLTSLPGASAVNTAISISGFLDKYFFYGFFPTKEKDLKHDLEILSKLNSSIIFFVASKKINTAIPIIKKNFSSREILICREMTKLYEEYLRCDVDSLKLFDKEPKGEITIVISEKKIIKKNSHILSESDKRIINKMIKKLSIREITDLINQNSKVSKKEIYNYCLKVKNEK